MILLDRPRQTGLTIIGIWLILTLLALLGRHATAIDETRYLSAAWEMWQRGDFLVPHLNGEPYHHKPPLLFWLIHLSWALLGVSEWAARLIPAVIGLAGALLAMPLASQLWPGKRRLASLAAWVVFSTTFWTLWTSAVMFDLLVAVCAEIALLGMLMAWRGRVGPGWLITGIGIGLGILAKGPVIFLYVLPAALLAPWWMTERRPRSWGRWYGGVVGAIALGALIGLSWALPAAAAGGESYANHLLWGQTAGRVVESFAHRRPIWWYLPLLPLLLFPWSLWQPLWRGVRERWREGWDSGERLSLLSTVTGIGIFSLVSGKQAHYLLPFFPLLALFAARALGSEDSRHGSKAWWVFALPVAPVVLLGILLFALPDTGVLERHAAWADQLSPLGGALIVLSALLSLLVARRLSPSVWPGMLSVLFLAASFAWVFSDVSRSYEVNGMGLAIGKAQREGHMVAVFGKYHGEFNFAGRLTQPVEEIGHANFAAWLALHPDGVIVVRADHPTKGEERGLRYSQPYRLSYMELRDAASWQPHESTSDL
jgi:4-amino-4-deoxy-L-arabinose transferase-like glycosyltransferase